MAGGRKLEAGRLQPGDHEAVPLCRIQFRAQGVHLRPQLARVVHAAVQHPVGPLHRRQRLHDRRLPFRRVVVQPRRLLGEGHCLFKSPRHVALRVRRLPGVFRRQARLLRSAGSAVLLIPDRRCSGTGDHQHHCSSQPRPRRIPLAPAPRPFHAAHRPGPDRLPALEAPQILRQCRRRRITLAWLFLEALQANRLQVARRLGLQPAHRDRILGQHLRQCVEYVRRLERRTPGQAFVEDRAESINVRCRTDLFALAAGLLGRHVGRAAQDNAG